MKPHDADQEIAFEAKIDGKLPYEDRAEVAALIDESRSISANAAFCVLDEICRPPVLGLVSQEQQSLLVGDWSSGFEHPLKGLMLRCAKALISDQPLPWSDGVSAIEEVGQYEGQRAALSLAYFSGDCTTKEGDDALNAAESGVRSFWEERGI